MKLILGMIMLSTTLSSMASICSPDTSKLMWDNDQINFQYECQNAKVKLCATKAIWGYTNTAYVVISGKNLSDKGMPSIYSSVMVKGDKEGSISENISSLILNDSPKPAIIIDEIKIRTEFNLSKTTGAATYTQESKKVLSLSGWKTDVNEALKCTIVK